MKKLAVVLVLFLGACATIQNPVTANELAAVESAYGVTLSVAVAYRNACARKASYVYPSCRSIVPRLQAAGRSAQTAVVAARKFVRENPTIDASSLISVARLAVDQFKTIADTNGVR